MAVDISEDQFQSAVLDKSKDVPVVVDFWAPWCGPCRQLTPALERAAEARKGKVELVKVNTDENQGISMAFQIQGIPAVKAFKDGREVSGFVGAIPPAKVEAFFDSLVPSEAEQLVAAGDEASLRQALEGSVFNAIGLPETRVSEDAAKAAGLTERETSILKALARGLSNDGIGKELWVAEQTVKFHLTNIYRKLGVSNRTEATRYAYENGLVDSPTRDHDGHH